MYLFFWLTLIITSLILIFTIDRFNSRSKKILYVFFAVFSSVLIALRPETIPDFKSYSRIYDYIQVGEKYGWNLFSKEYNTGVEYGFIYLTKWMKVLLGNNFRLFLFLLTFFSMLLLIEFFLKIIDKLEIVDCNPNVAYKLRNIMLLLYVPYFGLTYQGIAIRQAISFTLSIAMFYFFIDKKYVKSIVCFIVAFSIHRMSLISILPVVVYHFFPEIKKKKTYFCMGAMCLFGVIFFSFFDVFSYLLGYMKSIYDFLFGFVNYSGYVDKLSMTVSIDKKRVVVILLWLILVYFSKEHLNFNKLLNVYIVGLVILVLTSNIAGSARIYDYFIILYVPLLGVEYLEQKTSTLFKSGVCMLVLLNYIISFRIWNVI